MEKIRNRHDSVEKSLNHDLGSADSLQYRIGAHNYNFARGEEHKLSLTKKDKFSGSNNCHEQISSRSMSRAKNKKVLSPKVPIESRLDDVEITAIPALDDEMQFPALGCTKESPATTRERGGSFIAALSGGQGEPESALCGFLPQRDSRVTNLCAPSSAKHEIHIE